jgi:hypothetical protein
MGQTTEAAGGACRAAGGGAACRVAGRHAGGGGGSGAACRVAGPRGGMPHRLPAARQKPPRLPHPPPGMPHPPPPVNSRPAARHAAPCRAADGACRVAGRHAGWRGGGAACRVAGRRCCMPGGGEAVRHAGRRGRHAGRRGGMPGGGALCRAAGQLEHGRVLQQGVRHDRRKPCTSDPARRKRISWDLWDQCCTIRNTRPIRSACQYAYYTRIWHLSKPIRDHRTTWRTKERQMATPRARLWYIPRRGSVGCMHAWKNRVVVLFGPARFAPPSAYARTTVGVFAALDDGDVHGLRLAQTHRAGQLVGLEAQRVGLRQLWTPFWAQLLAGPTARLAVKAPAQLRGLVQPGLHAGAKGDKVRAGLAPRRPATAAPPAAPRLPLRPPVRPWRPWRPPSAPVEGDSLPLRPAAVPLNG